MARIAVVGGGFAGMSAAARLAKLRHDVTLVEKADYLGGRLLPMSHGPPTSYGRWYLHCPTVTLPAVLRDLFRKSGRPLERELTLHAGDGRRHIWPGGTILDLPAGNRADQHHAISRAFDADCAEDWCHWVDQWADTWDILRRVALDRVYAGTSDFSRSQWRRLRPRRSLRREARRGPADKRLASLVTVDARLSGHQVRRVPAAWAVQHYIERKFGRWSIAGGPQSLAAALHARLTERHVDVRLGVTATRLRPARPGIDTDTGPLDADIVLWCAGTEPTSGSRARLPLIPSARTLITLNEPDDSMPPDITLHADPPLRLWSADHQHWTIVHTSADDPLEALARAGMDLRDRVQQRHEVPPRELVGMAGFGTQVSSLRDGFAQLSALRHHAGSVWSTGSHASSGSGIETIGLATAAIAEHIGSVPRTRHDAA